MAKRLVVEEKPTLWKDRKRILGMPISFTRYRATEDRLYLKKGFFNTETDEILIYRIMDIRLVRKFWQKLFGVGTLILMSTDKSTPTLELKNIRHSDTVRKFMSGLIEKQREARRIAGREYMGGAISDYSGGFDF